MELQMKPHEAGLPSCFLNVPVPDSYRHLHMTRQQWQSHRTILRNLRVFTLYKTIDIYKEKATLDANKLEGLMEKLMQKSDSLMQGESGKTACIPTT